MDKLGNSSLNIISRDPHSMETKLDFKGSFMLLSRKQPMSAYGGELFDLLMRLLSQQCLGFMNTMKYNLPQKKKKNFRLKQLSLH